jgi:hypothetical protein
MSTRRQLADTLIDMVDGMAFAPAGMGLRVTSIEMTLPVEVSMAAGSEQAGALPGQRVEPLFLADLPQSVYRTAFDYQPSKLTVIWAEGATP